MKGKGKWNTVPDEKYWQCQYKTTYITYVYQILKDIKCYTIRGFQGIFKNKNEIEQKSKNKEINIQILIHVHAIISLGQVFDLVERHQALSVLVVTRSDSALCKLCVPASWPWKKRKTKRKTMWPIKMVSFPKLMSKNGFQVNDGTFNLLWYTCTNNKEHSHITVYIIVYGIY